MSGSTRERTQLPWRYLVGLTVLRFVATAAFPRLAHRLRWPTRLGLLGFAVYVAVNTLIGFAARHWMNPRLRRMGERQERAREELRTQLGREPTGEELSERFMATFKR